jgi:TRAP-type C4-dicarboxylate transport system permease small subunit
MWVKLQKRVDELMTAIAAILVAIMFIVIIANVILRLIPAVGGFSWYMEFSQYANVWGMLIGAVGIACAGTNLRVEVIDSLLKKWKYGYKFTRIVIDIAELIFYIVMTYSGYLLASKAKQRVSTMPDFTMGQVYMIFPIAGALCIFAVFVHLMVTLTTKAGEEKQVLDESQTDEEGIK